MTLIYTAAQFALRRERSADELREALQKVLREAKRSTELINQLLWLARSDAGNLPPELAPSDIAARVREAVHEVTVLAADKGLGVSASIPATSVQASIDEVSFRRMLLILLDNAIKYTPAGGRVAVSVTEEAAGLAIAVADTVPGIPPDDLPLIFNRFWRADKVRSRDAGGTGLGLAIAREIAERHHATLTVESTVGQGSTFTVRLPRGAGQLVTAGTPREESA
jgi:two-component system sensor histidine kinase ResE